MTDSLGDPVAHTCLYGPCCNSAAVFHVSQHLTGSCFLLSCGCVHLQFWRQELVPQRTYLMDPRRVDDFSASSAFHLLTQSADFLCTGLETGSPTSKFLEYIIVGHTQFYHQETPFVDFGLKSDSAKEMLKMCIQEAHNNTLQQALCFFPVGHINSFQTKICRTQ